MIRNVAYNYRTLEEWTINNQSNCRNFTIYAALLMLIGCLEREFLKNGLKSDVNSKLKSDLIIDIDFSFSIEIAKKLPISIIQRNSLNFMRP